MKNIHLPPSHGQLYCIIIVWFCFTDKLSFDVVLKSQVWTIPDLQINLKFGPLDLMSLHAKLYTGGNAEYTATLLISMSCLLTAWVYFTTWTMIRLSEGSGIYLVVASSGKRVHSYNIILVQDKSVFRLGK